MDPEEIFDEFISLLEDTDQREYNLKIAGIESWNFWPKSLITKSDPETIRRIIIFKLFENSESEDAEFKKEMAILLGAAYRSTYDYVDDDICNRIYTRIGEKITTESLELRSNRKTFTPIIDKNGNFSGEIVDSRTITVSKEALNAVNQVAINRINEMPISQERKDEMIKTIKKVQARVFDNQNRNVI